MNATGRPFLASLLLTFSLASASAQSLSERDRCYRAEVTALFERSIWLPSSNAAIFSTAEGDEAAFAARTLDRI